METNPVVPPPFEPREQSCSAAAAAPVAVEQPEAADNRPAAVSPTVEQVLATLDLTAEQRESLSQVVGGLDPATLTAPLLALLHQGVKHDEDVRDADAAGYLRGRNDNIDAVLRTQPVADEAAAERRPMFPVYHRRSVWD